MNKKLFAISIMLVLAASAQATSKVLGTQIFQTKAHQIGGSGAKMGSGSDIFLPYQKTVYGTSSSATAVTISSAGAYLLSSDISSHSNATNVVAITGSDITLDLGGKSISGNGTSTGIGINVSSGLSNITIKNGVVRNLNNSGIKIGAGCSHIRIENIAVIDCDSDGILINGTSAGSGTEVNDVVINNVIVTKCNGGEDNTTSVKGLSLNFCTQANVFNSSFDENIGSIDEPTPAYGVFMTSCTGCHFENCEAIGNSALAAHGFYIEHSYANTFQNCSSYQNTGTSGIGSGFYTSAAFATMFNNCEAIGTMATTTAYGFYLNNSEDSEIVDCKISRIVGYDDPSTLDALGIYAVNGANNLIKDCSIIGCVGVGASNKAVGVMLSSETRSRIEGTEVNACTSVLGRGYGIYLASISTIGTSIAKNIICGNSGNEASYGIYDDASDSVTFFLQNVCYGQESNNYSITYSDGSFDENVKNDAVINNFGNLITAKTSPHHNISVLNQPASI
ncbi:hypothetical protein HN446_02405 [bacterium]|jgi:hypothetical protein|nr:hypothetical protein [bacterium]